jgi:hypothetical protein
LPVRQRRRPPCRPCPRRRRQPCLRHPTDPHFRLSHQGRPRHCRPWSKGIRRFHLQTSHPHRWRHQCSCLRCHPSQRCGSHVLHRRTRWPLQCRKPTRGDGCWAADPRGPARLRLYPSQPTRSTPPMDCSIDSVSWSPSDRTHNGEIYL